MILVAAAATLVFAIAPSAAAQVAISGTFHGPHGAVHFNSGHPYAQGGHGYGHGYRYSGYCDPGYAYAPVPVYVPRYRVHRRDYSYRDYSYRTHRYGRHGGHDRR